MRAIDADDLISFLIKAGRFVKGQDDKRTAAHAIGKIIEHVEKMPTIDAIPVEWMKDKRENLILAAMVHSNVYGDNSVELCHAVNVVLDMWQKEREAR